MEIDFSNHTYDQITKVTQEMADLDNMLPNLDDLESSIGSKVDRKKTTVADETLQQRASMSIFDIIDLVKSRVSIFGIYKLHDDVEFQNARLSAEIKIANAKLEYLYRQLDKKRNSSKKKTSDMTPKSGSQIKEK